ncbi:MAG: outer membrane protein assembly factor BamA [Gammaproteobacteria bacterium]|nr:outer membrane protein assembly factor BamA [Gammaproteobacteria bacterium]
MRHVLTLQRARRSLLLIGAGLLWQGMAWAFTPFTIRSIKAEGLQRLELGTVLTYLPLSVGDQLNDTTSAQAIRALYASGLFRDVELLKGKNDALIIEVQERPQIAEFEIKGNEKIGGDKLKESLRQIGLVKGALFKRDLLDQLTQDLRGQYYANGFYAVDIKTTVDDLPNNRVSIHIKVGEGKPAKIKQINIIGNVTFPESTLLDQLKLKTPYHFLGIGNPFQTSDQYSREQLSGDLEALQSYYQDRGYLKFGINSVQVAISPSKKDVYITINVDEGDKYKVSGFTFSGDTVLNTDFLGQLVTTQAGEEFSRKQATDTASRIESALSDIGYAFAKVTPLPEVDDPKHEVRINYAVTPGRRVYVRHISFSGYGDTRDSTLRREMRQLEAAPFSKGAVERSRVRLQRLPFVEAATVKTTPVPGTKDQVDVNYDLKLRAPGSIQFGIGFSGAGGFLLSGSVTHTNFLGTGNTVSLSATNSQVNRAFSLSWTNPYFTADGISQTVDVFFNKSKSVIRFSSGFDTNTIGGDLVYGLPLSEFATLSLGGGASRTAVTTFPGVTANEVLAFVLQNGTQFSEFTLKGGVARDTRNRTFFATRGMLDQLRLNLQLPGSGLEYYTLNLRHEQYIPLLFKTFLQFNANIGYVDTYGKTKGTPPWENLFAGGAGTVRGFKDGFLGPLDSNGNPFGGRLLTTTQSLLVIPLPIPTDQKTTRFGLFFDAGNVFAKPGDFSVNQLRASGGVAVQWFSPLVGLMDLSYAFPVHRLPGDRTSGFQINFGNSFQ